MFMEKVFNSTFCTAHKLSLMLFLKITSDVWGRDAFHNALKKCRPLLFGKNSAV